MKKFLIFLFFILLFSFYSYLVLYPQTFNLNFNIAETANLNSLYNGKLAPRLIRLFFFIN